VIILALTSPTRTPGQIYDAVSNLVQQKIAQVPGVGDVELGGGSQPAVRVDLVPFALNRYGISSEDVRAALQASTPTGPRATSNCDGKRLQIYTGTGMANGGTASDYRGLVVAWRNGAAVRLQDIAEVSDGVENINTIGLFNGQPAVIVLVTLQPGANVIDHRRRRARAAADAAGAAAQGRQAGGRVRPHQFHPLVAARGGAHAGHRHRCWWCWW
jgi:multidrug efflux pump